MNKFICYTIAASLTILMTGCANGPIRNFFRGEPCNACQPASQPSFGSHSIGTCTQGCPTPGVGIPSPVIQPGQVGTSINPYPTTQVYGQPTYGQLPSQTPNITPTSGSTTKAYGMGASGNILNPPTSNSNSAW